jgi:predicted Zn-dependent peptidase
MKIWNWLAMFWTLILVMPAWAGYERLGGVLPDDPMAVQSFRLDNGLVVNITENHESPRFYAEIAVRAGSKNDPAETTGLAHYFEHLMFKGTRKMGTLDYAKEKIHLDRIKDLYETYRAETDPERRAELYAQIDAENLKAADYAAPNELDRIYKSMGGSDINAHTGTEETVYKVGLPKNRLRQWAALEADRFAQPVFRLFPQELETVYEEKNRAMDNKQRIIFEAVDSTLYKNHPYGQQTTLGRTDHLKNPSIINIRNFFEAWYVPENMALSIAGDIDTEECIQIVDEYFSSLAPKKPPRQTRWKEKKLAGREEVVVQYEGEEFVLLAFRTASRKHKDAEALQLLDMILDNATAGLINLNLNQSQRVRQAGSFPRQQNDYGAQYLYGIPKKDQTLQEVEQLLLEQIGIIKKGEFEDWILPAIINDFKKREKTGLESNNARASSMSQAFLAYEPWKKKVGTLARMEKITKKDIVRVANKYFGDNYVAGLRKDAPHDIPSVEKPELSKVEIDPRRQSAFAQELMAMPVTPIEPTFVNPDTDYAKLELTHGRTLYYAPNPINDVFNFSIHIDFGSHQDNTIASAVQLLQKSGTERLSPVELQKEWYKLGTDFSIGAGDNETTIHLSGLDENLEASIALLMEVISKPAAEDATLEELKKIILASREDAKKQAPSIAKALVQFNRNGEDSVYLRMLSTETLQALNVDQLHKVTKNLLGYKYAVAYTGSLPLEEVQALLEKHHPLDAPLLDPPPYRSLKARSPKETEIYFVHKETAQSQVRLELGGPDFNEDLNPAIALYNNYFAGGMAGIVFQELREARGLAYLAAARYFIGYRNQDQDLMVGVIQTQNDKTVEAIQAFVELLDTLPESPERFAMSQQSLINQFRTAKIGFRSVLGAIRGWERHGLAPDPRKARYEKIQIDTLDNVIAFQKAHIGERAKLISIVGDQAKIDLEALKQTGPIRVLSLDEIFVK